MKFGVVTFPGSNCNQDMVYTLKNKLNQEVVELWHKDTSLQGCDAIVYREVFHMEITFGLVLLPVFHQ